jgi:hypothetical protein
VPTTDQYLSPEQAALVAAIEEDAVALASHEVESKEIRNRLQEKMAQAKKLNVSSYKIAKAAKISQPRVMQIIKEIADAST